MNTNILVSFQSKYFLCHFYQKSYLCKIDETFCNTLLQADRSLFVGRSLILHRARVKVF